MATVLITGGSGLVGRHLIPKLRQKGYEVAILSRGEKQQEGITTYHWNPETGDLDRRALLADYIIHLAGANIAAGRWTAARKKEIVDSRVKTALLLYEELPVHHHLKAFISASAVGYYGLGTSEKIFEEDEKPAYDFLANTCLQWEKAADKFSERNVRVVKLRTAPVMAADGGAWPMLRLPVNLGFSAPLGSGTQYMPWIHVDDLCAIYLQAVESQAMQGVYNAAAPGHVTNAQFMKTAAQVMHRPFFAPHVPAFAIHLALGEMGEGLLQGSRVSPEKILSTGFRFQYPMLKEALDQIEHSRKDTVTAVQPA
jgi:uncharacterized protein